MLSLIGMCKEIRSVQASFNSISLEQTFRDLTSLLIRQSMRDESLDRN